MKLKEKKIKLNPIAIVTIVILIAYVISMLIPVFWTLMTSFKSLEEYNYGDIFATIVKPNKLGFPKKLTFENYVTAYSHFNIEVEIEYEGLAYKVKYGILGQFLNSLKYAVGCGITTTFTSLVMGYAVARFKYKFSNYIYAFVIITMALPIVGAMPSEIRVAQ